MNCNAQVRGPADHLLHYSQGAFVQRHESIAPETAVLWPIERSVEVSGDGLQAGTTFILRLSGGKKSENGPSFGNVLAGGWDVGEIRHLCDRPERIEGRLPGAVGRKKAVV